MNEPESMDDLVYFTNRAIGSGSVKAWVYKQPCPKCGKTKLGKPTDNKGRIQIRAKEYVCGSCRYKVDKNSYEESLFAEVKYTCPACGSAGETKVPFKRKNIAGVATLRINCQKCKANIDITKKMKEPKNKGAFDE